jgi:ribosome maturation factor RimP
MGAWRPFFVKGANGMVNVRDRERTLEREITQAVEEGIPGTEVLAVELLGPERFCVYVDHPGGVDHALCTRVTDVLRGYLDRYTIDVSSPGTERPLRKPGHFRNAVGRRVALRTHAEIGGRRRFRGEVLAAGEQALTVRAGEQDFDIPYEAIVRGNLIDEE